MKIQFLGTGTSIGVPAIGCDCAVCRSTDPRNRRRRASLYVMAAGKHLVVDTAPDFREQVLTFKVARMDALLYTHAHADHIVGFDDIRRFNEVQKAVIPVYGAPATLADLARMFPYIHQAPRPGLSYPRVTLHEVTGPFAIGEIQVEPLPADHVVIPTIGYRFAAEGRVLAYVPDCRKLEETVIQRLRGCDVMILDALRIKPHPSHFSVAESVAVLQQIGAKQSYITNLSHFLDHAETQRQLPPGITVPHDGLTVEL